MIRSGLVLGAALFPLAAAAQPAAEPMPSAGMQWLYGSGEGGAASLQVYGAFRDYVLRRARHRPARSVVLGPGATLAAPAAGRPLAGCAGPAAWG